jgi:transcriptional regulator with XRE-family HTH domain
MSEANKPPFRSLGSHLKYVREQSNQSLAEVSGAVEIDEQYLKKIEAGLVRPDEEILLLLISYFGVKDREAVQLWELAKYDNDMPDEIRVYDDTVQLNGKQVIMLLAMDMRTIYSDGLDVTVSPSGVTLNFTQLQSQGPQTNSVARVGMSHAQAEAVVQTLQKALLHAKYNNGIKLLPPNTSNK